MTSRPSFPAEAYRSFQRFLEEASGIVLGDGKEYLVNSRLNGLLQQHGIDTFGTLLTRLVRDNDRRLRTAVIDAMTTNETFWFRDPAHFRLLNECVLPELEAARRGARIWSAACSSGQEPYSIAMATADYRARNGNRLGGIEILATDLSTKVLDEARRGVYCGLSISRGLDTEQRRRFFVPHGDCVEVRPEIRGQVRFRELNLTQRYEPLGRFDVIFCRNVLIYFSSARKSDIIGRLADTLNPGGYLFLGSTESLSAHSDRFAMIASDGGIVYRLKPR